MSKKVDINWDDSVPEALRAGEVVEGSEVEDAPNVLSLPIAHPGGQVKMVTAFNCDAVTISQVGAPGNDKPFLCIALAYGGGGLFIPFSPKEAIEFADFLKKTAEETASIDLSKLKEGEWAETKGVY